MILMREMEFGLPSGKAMLSVFMLVASLAFAGETNLTLTVDGVTYSNVTFGTTTPSSVSIRHSIGITTVPLDKLPPNLQQRFGYDPKKAAEYRKAEAEKQAAWQKSEQQRRDLLKQQAKEKELENKANEPKGRPEYKHGNVFHVLDDGLLLGDLSGNSYLLVGYPDQKKAVEGDEITCWAARSGKYVYIDTSGAQRTVGRYIWVRKYVLGEPI
ncbi:MAG: hypothetical protein ABSA97_01355 [Verrucomicrobiia bacterium]|jgi:hypothetical protein